MNSNQQQLPQPELRLKSIVAACRQAMANWPRPINRRRASMAAGILLGSLSCQLVYADHPVMCTAGACSGREWNGNPATTIATYNTSGINPITGSGYAEVNQRSQSAILNWASFNVSNDVHVRFRNDTYGADSSTLNRIYQATPSSIAGRISGDGRLYLINQNGIIFRNGSQVDTHSLIASTLDIKDAIYSNGLLTAFKETGDAAFTLFGNALPSGGITVENGATITAGKSGAVMLFAPMINQNGLIKTEDGQVILAAGNKIYITGSDNVDLRGLVVEVDVTEVSDAQLDAFKQDSSATASLPAGTVTNNGMVEALRGNVSMIGLAINQQGIVHATTAVGGNGSVILKARDKVVPVPVSGQGYTFVGGTANARDGRVTFARGSQTIVDNDTNTANLTASDAQKPLPSTITASGRQILLQDGSELIAVGGKVELSAQKTNTDPQLSDLPVDDARIQLEAGSRIDVSGGAVNLAMSRNELEVRLTSNELNGLPLQVNGILSGETVKVDIRDADKEGRIPIGNIAAAVNNIAKTVDEHTTTGGTVSLNSQGSVVFAKGASIDVSGGSITYADGFISTTKLTSNGKDYDIGKADPNLIYDGIVGQVSRRSDRWGITRTWGIGGLANQAAFHRGYVDGQDAGTVNIAAHGMILNGDLIAHTTNGERQRQVGDRALGGRLIIGLENGIGLDSQKSYRAPNINIGEYDLTHFDQIKSDYALTDKLPQELADQAYLSTRAFEQGGFNRLKVTSNGVISNQQLVLDQTTQTLRLAEGSALHLAPGGEVTLNAQQVRLYGDITAVGGNISVNAKLLGDIDRSSRVIAQAAPSTVAVDSEVSGLAQLVVGDNVRLSVAGQWVNDRQGVAAPIPTDGVFINGGKITLNASEAETLVIGKNVSMDVQGGAWLNASNKLTAGRGGDITVTMGKPTDINPKAIFGGNLQLQGHALREGGKLNLTMAGFDISGDPSITSRAAQAAAWEQRQVVQAGVPGTRSSLQLPVALFSDNGFASITLNSNQGDIQIHDNTIIVAQQQNRILDNSFVDRVSASTLSDFSRLDQLEPYLRKPVNLQFNINNQSAATSSAPRETDRASIYLGNHAAILADAGATIGMRNNSGGAITIDGRIEALGGVIRLELTHGQSQLFVPSHRITLGEGAVLSTAGTFIPQPSSNGQQRGQVLDGGQVSLSANGYIDAQAGSVIDVSGAKGVVDLAGEAGQLTSQTIGSNAGTITLSSNQGIVTDGELIGHAASNQQRGGTLNLTLGVDGGTDVANQHTVSDSYNPFLSSQQLALERTVSVSQTRSTQALQSGVVNISQQQLQQGGFDQLILTATGAQSYADRTGVSHSANADISFNGNVDLAMRQGITLDSQRITASDNANVNLTAPYIRLGDPDASVTLDPNTGNISTAQATITADLLDIVGRSSWQGFAQLSLHSRGDLRFSSDVSRRIDGELASAGVLRLTADQIYPTTLTNFRLTSTFAPTAANPDSIYIGRNEEASPASPFSAGGTLHLDAASIKVDGTLRAPLGNLVLGTETTDRVTVTANGVLSTSLDGTNVLFGRISNQQWYYQTDGVADELASGQARNQLPQQQVSFNGNRIEMNAGSQVDVRGGGDLLAWDYLARGRVFDPLSSANAGNYFAILPTQPGQYAPYDPQEFTPYDPTIIRAPKDPQPSFFIRPGDSVYLSGGGGVAAGNYAILPARYALLPGAMLVEELPTQRDRPVGSTGALADGTSVVAGYHTLLNSGFIESRTRSFALHPGSYAYQLAEFSLTRATDYLRATQEVGQRTPADAGHLIFNAQDEIVLNGELHAAARPGGRGAAIDFVGTNLRVTNQRDASITNSVQLIASELNALAAESILLGGQREFSNGQNSYRITANTVELADNVQLIAPEWILSAQQGLTLGNNVIVNATGSLTAPDQSSWHIDANSLLLQLSAGKQINLVRDGERDNTRDPRITLGSNLALQADHSILLDVAASTSAVNLQGRLQFNNAGGKHDLSLSADAIHLDAVTTAQSGLHISSSELSATALNTLHLRGRQQLVFGESSDLSAHTLQIDTAALRGSGALGTTAQLRGDQILFTPTGNTAPSGIATGQGTLLVSAATITLGDTTQPDQQHQFAIDGFNQINVTASGDIRAAGDTTLNSSGDVSFTSARFTAQSGAGITLNATSHKVSFNGNANTGTLAGSTDLGARLQVNADDIAVAGHIEMHSGIVDLHATGTAPGQGVRLGDNAVIDVSGINKSFAELVRGTPGGTVKLRADNGLIHTSATSMINISGANVGGDAGLLTVSAVNSNTQLQGQLQGAAATEYHSGRFRLDTQTLDGSYSDLNTRLNAGGFHGERSVRLRGDSAATDITVNNITVAASDAVAAEQVKFIADQGSILVAGNIDASGKNGGDITLLARDAVQLATTGILDAHATAAGGNGGNVVVESRDDGIYLDGAVNVTRGSAVIANGEQGREGQVKLRLPRASLLTLTDADTTNDKLRINNTGMQADYLQIEGAQQYSASAITPTDTAISGTWNTDATSFMVNAAAITTALGDLATRTDLHLRAGVEVQSTTGDLTLDAPWDLSAWRPGTEPINLTLRAAGNLNINQSISDGFVGFGNVLLDQRSADLSLVAGADLNSVDRAAVINGTGTVNIGSNVNIGTATAVRTGTGDISVAAGKDIVLAQNISTIYTAGRRNGLALDLAGKGVNAVKALPTQGGDLTLRAGDKIVGPTITTTRQLFTEWFQRQGAKEAVLPTPRLPGKPGENAGWYINYAGFNQNFAAFGGGDLYAEAGDEIKQVSFSAPTTGYYDLQTQQEVRLGNGKLTVHADGDIVSSNFFVGDGTGRISGDGTLIESVFELMAGSFRTFVRGDIKVSLENPTLINSAGTIEPYFFTYGANSTAAFQTLAGSMDLAGHYLPSNLILEANSGDITLADANATLFPSSMGDLTLLADQSLNVAGFYIGTIPPDTAWDIRQVATSRSTSFPDRSSDELLSVDIDRRAIPSLHQEDREPIWLVANQGDVSILNTTISPKPLRISAGRDLRINNEFYVTHTRQDQVTQLSAGRDILFTQELSTVTVYGPGQLLLDAGRNVDLGVGAGVLTQGDLRFPELVNNGTDITVLAGLSGVAPQYSQFLQKNPQFLARDNAVRDRFLLQMQQQQGNPQLTVAEAITAYQTLSAKAQSDVRTASAVSARELINIEAVELFQQQSTAYLQDLRNDPKLTRAQALADFSSLPLAQQRPLILQAFFAELRTAGRVFNLADASAEDKNYAGGYRALEALFPGSSVRTSNYHGDVNLFFSQIKTEDGGDINILVPGGIINAGLAVQPPGAPEKDASELGIVAAREGSIRIYTHNDVQVNQSRIFTLGGGDILLWSSYGDIDAGRGAKSAISAPPPTLSIDSQGNVALNFAGAVSGSGIRVICTTDCDDNGGFISIIKDKGPGIKYSNADVDLVAPFGTVSAGEAGIGSAGNLFIAAQQVLGADNINVVGTSVGVPVTNAAPVITPAVTDPNNTKSDTASIGKEPVYKQIGEGSSLMLLDVEVISFGNQEDDEKRKSKNKVTP